MFIILRYHSYEKSFKMIELTGIHCYGRIMCYSFGRLRQRELPDIQLLDVLHRADNKAGVRGQGEAVGEVLRVEAGHAGDLAGIAGVQQRERDLLIARVDDCRTIAGSKHTNL